MILWEVETGDIIGRFAGHANWVFSAAFTPAGSRIISASRDQSFIVWDAATGVPLHTYAGEGGFALNFKLLAGAT